MKATPTGAEAALNAAHVPRTVAEVSPHSVAWRELERCRTLAAESARQAGDVIRAEEAEVLLTAHTHASEIP